MYIQTKPKEQIKPLNCHIEKGDFAFAKKRPEYFALK